MFSSRVVLLGLLATLCAACAAGNGDSSLSAPQRTQTSSPTSPSRDAVPSYLQTYSAEQRTAYAAAVASEAAFDRRNARILAAGKTTKAASAFYHRYSIDWASDWSSLAELANNNATVTGRTKIRWTRPIAIHLPGNGTSVVVLRRCLDQSNLVVTQNGHQLAQPQLKRPRAYKLRLVRRQGEDWWRSGISANGSPC
jgi:hypothetical protein